MALGWLWDGFGVALGGLSAGASRKRENSVIMRLPWNLVSRIAPMNLKMRKCLIINDRILRFMGRIAGSTPGTCARSLGSLRGRPGLLPEGRSRLGGGNLPADEIRDDRCCTSEEL